MNYIRAQTENLNRRNNGDEQDFRNWKESMGISGDEREEN